MKFNQLSSGLSLSNETGKISFLYSFHHSSIAWGAISKTTNTGQSWSIIFQSEQGNNYYFNSIACSSISHCVAVTEGSEYSHLHAFITFDGGQTWKDSFQNNGSDILPSNVVSLMCASWIGTGDNAQIGWIGGASMDYFGRVTGLFYQTINGGITYTLQQVTIFTLFFYFNS